MASAAYKTSSEVNSSGPVAPQLTHRPFSDSIVHSAASSSENLVQNRAQRGDGEPLPGDLTSIKRTATTRRRRERDGRRNRRPKAPGVWKKILWVKQSCTTSAAFVNR